MTTALILLFIIAACHCFYAVRCGFTRPLAVDQHAFRASQTTIDVWSILRTGRNELPVLGCSADGNWNVPMEFPLYQRCVAAVVPMFKGNNRG